MGARRGESRSGWRRRVLAGALAATSLLQVPACASDVAHSEGRWTHRELEASVADPDPATGPWKRRKVEGAALSFAGPAGATLSWIRQCGRGQLAPDVAIRHLFIGVAFEAEPEEGPLEVRGRPGWRLRATTDEEGRSIALQAVTRVGPACIDDFLLIQPVSAASPERDAAFDAWWRSFRDHRDASARVSPPSVAPAAGSAASAPDGAVAP